MGSMPAVYVRYRTELFTGRVYSPSRPSALFFSNFTRAGAPPCPVFMPDPDALLFGLHEGETPCSAI